MIVWTIGMFVAAPIAMILLPYSIGMPFGTYGSSPLALFKDGGLFVLFLVWVLGAISGLLAHILNPLEASEMPSREQMHKGDSHSKPDAANAKQG